MKFHFWCRQNNVPLKYDNKIFFYLKKSMTWDAKKNSLSLICRPTLRMWLCITNCANVRTFSSDDRVNTHKFRKLSLSKKDTLKQKYMQHFFWLKSLLVKCIVPSIVKQTRRDSYMQTFLLFLLFFGDKCFLNSFLILFSSCDYCGWNLRS